MKNVEHNAAVRQITNTLKGPVAAVFRDLVPAFGDMSGDDFYDAVLGSSDLLHGLMLIFHKRRDAFAHLLVDAQGRPVNDDFVRLRCGRSVHDIISMIVRTHAKKHFRSALGGDPNNPDSKAGRLYQAMNEYLIHEWQVPLVPHYAGIPVAKMRELGPMLLDLKTAAEVQEVASKASARIQLEAPAKPANANTHAAELVQTRAKLEEMVVENRSREQEFWWETLNDNQVRQALANPSESDMREYTAAFCQLGDATRSELLAPLGLSLYQAAVLLGTCHRTLGRAAFGQIFGKPGSAGAVTAFTAKLKAKGVSSRTDVRNLGRAVEGVLSTMPRPGARARA
ncbi:MAG: hypothetical protein ACM3Q1_03160 [Bacteroidales bacterium]